MDLSTTWLGLDLPHPFVPGASPFAGELDSVLRLEDAGAAAIVMYSLFEEQITREERGAVHAREILDDAYAEATSFLPDRNDLSLGPEHYLDQIRRIKERVSMPVIASLNGTTAGGWLHYAKAIQEAGADALELNVYELASDPTESGAQVEARVLEMLREVKQQLAIPIAVKLSPFYSSLAWFARQLDENGADGLVLFNRFYQPDIEPEDLEVLRTLRLSDSSELLLRLRWLAILSGNLNAGLAVSGGVHDAVDAVKAVMAGAHAVQVVSALLIHGIEHLTVLRQGLQDWLEMHEYRSLAAMRGCMNLARCPNPGEFERANYMEILHSWQHVP